MQAAHLDEYTADATEMMRAVFEELCQVVEEAIELYRKDDKLLPPATSGRDFANRMQQVA